MYRSRPTPLALVGLFVCVTGCTSHTQIELAQVADYDNIELTMIGGGRTEMRRATVESDSIRGQIRQASRIGGPAWGDTAAVSLSEVENIVAIESKTAGTVGATLSIVLPLALLSLAFSKKE